MSEQQQKPDAKEIIILGAGPSGLTLLHSLQRLDAMGKSFKIVIFEQKSEQEFLESLRGQHGGDVCLIYEYARMVLEKLLINNIESESTPIPAIQSHDIYQSQQSQQNPEKLLVDWSIPNNALLAMKKADLLRGLCSAIAGRKDSQALDEGLIEMLRPFIKFGHQLDSFVISAESGTVYTQFTNGFKTTCHMLLGCDGPTSFTRTHLFNSRLALQYIPQLVLTGLSPRKEAVDGIKSWIGDGIRASLMDVGEFTKWTLIVPQAEPGQKATDLVIPKRRLTSVASSSKATSSQGPTSDMTGEECRELALQLLHSQLPHLQSVISETIPHLTTANDNMDLHGESVPLESYTSPNFHPGRVMLVGGSVHPLSSTIHGSHSTSLSITDSHHLASLIIKHHSEEGYAEAVKEAVHTEAPTTPDMLVLASLAKEYMKSRGGIGNKALVDQYKQAVWTKPSEGLWGSVMLMTGMSSVTWATGTVEDEIQRGV